MYNILIYLFTLTYEYILNKFQMITKGYQKSYISISSNFHHILPYLGTLVETKLYKEIYNTMFIFI